MDNTVILGLDPSFHNLAYALLVKDTIYIGKCTYPLGDTVGFEKIFSATRDLKEQLLNKLCPILKENKVEIDKVFSEVPPPVGQYSPGLFALDNYILNSLWNTFPSIQEMYAIPPSYLTALHGSKYKKSDSTALAKYLLYEVLADKFSMVIEDSISPKGRVTKGTLNNDKAEATLFLLKAICKYDIKGCRDILANEMGGFLKESEKLLIKR